MKRILPTILFLVVISGSGGAGSTSAPPGVKGRAEVTGGARPHRTMAGSVLMMVGMGTIAVYAGLRFVRLMNEDPALQPTNRASR
jgi:hypothetical protein